LIFRQLFDLESYTYTYLLGCPKTRAAVIIDPVDTQVCQSSFLCKMLPGHDMISSSNM